MRNFLYEIHDYVKGTYQIDAAEVAKRLHHKHGVITEDLYWIDLDNSGQLRRIVAWPQSKGKIITRWDIFDLEHVDELHVDRYIFGLQSGYPFNPATAELKDFDPKTYAQLSRKSADTDEDYDDDLAVLHKEAKLTQGVAMFWLHKFEGEALAKVEDRDDDEVVGNNIDIRLYIAGTEDFGAFDPEIALEKVYKNIFRGYHPDDYASWEDYLVYSALLVDILNREKQIIAAGKLFLGDDWSSKLHRNDDPEYAKFVKKATASSTDAEFLIESKDKFGKPRRWAVSASSAEDAITKACEVMQRIARFRGEAVKLEGLLDLHRYLTKREKSVIFKWAGVKYNPA